jgi:sugar O-acyltransferase (sialic acid O-acetyltransferase NeuD family)
MKKVVIFGAGATGRLARVYLAKDSPHQVAAFTVHTKHLDQGRLLGLDVVPFERLEDHYPPDQFAMFVAIGYEQVNQLRARLYKECRSRGYELISYISSRAIHWGEVEIGENCLILEGSVLQPFAKIGNNVTIGCHSHVGHDAEIGDHCYLAAGSVVPGHVRVGQYSFIGTNATIRNAITIAPECVIGAGAVILRDTKPGAVYIGKNTAPVALPSSVLGSFL